MTTLDLLERLERADVVLAANGDKLRCDAPAGAMTPDLLDTLREAKPILLAPLAGDWKAAAVAMTGHQDDPEQRADLLYQFDERAAIAEYDGGQDRHEAERLAMDQVADEIQRIGRDQDADGKKAGRRNDAGAFFNEGMI